MPPVRSVSCDDNIITIIDSNGIQKQLLASDIPAAQNTIAKIETYLNTIWIPANIINSQVQIHVISISPLRVAIIATNSNLFIRFNWWIK